MCKEWNLYDFDGTVYKGDSSLDFYFFALRRNPGLIRFWPGQLRSFLLYRAKKIDKTAFKQGFFRFLQGIDASSLLEPFWNSHEKKIYAWFLNREPDRALVISASPEFLLEPVCIKLDIPLIASKVDIRSGVISGKNCRGEEKVSRFRQRYGAAPVDKCYSDSEADLPMLRLAREAYLIKDGKPVRISVSPAPEQ